MVDISERELELPDAVIGSLLKIAAEDKSVISLGPGEPDFITPKPILDYAKKRIAEATKYSAPAGRTELREAICKKLKKENKINADINNVVVTAGSQEGLFNALLCTLDPTEQVVLPNPSYLGYIPAIELVEGVPIYIKLEEKDDFAINPDLIRKIIDKKKTKIILINTPANPTGNVLSRKILEEIADIAVDTNTYVFSDEAYEHIIYDDNKHVSIGSLNGMEDYAVSFFSFSKSYAMCGFRLGYVVGPERLMKEIDKSSHYVTICPPHISQFAGIKALQIGKKYTEKMVEEYKKRRNFIVKRLNEIGLPTRMPGGAFYTFSNIQEYSNNSFEFAKEILKKAKVAVVPGTEFGIYGEGYIRCSYATDIKKIEIAMDRLEKFLKNKKRN